LSRLFSLAAALHAWVLVGILIMAFVEQFSAGEPPCPLCIMQRIAFMLAATGPALLLQAANEGQLQMSDVCKAAGIMICASLLGAAISMRQVLLHILPGSPGYGGIIWGYHLYTWALVAFVCSLIASGLQVLCLPLMVEAREPDALARILARPTILFLKLILLANILSVSFEAGLAWDVPSNPVTYLLLR
jgi:Disulfide bond formation protein DsbB